MFDKEFWDHLKADNFYALKLGTLKCLAVGFAILFILNMILWRAGTGIFHMLIGSDPAYDGGPGWGGKGFNASAVMLILSIGFFIGCLVYEKPSK